MKVDLSLNKGGMVRHGGYRSIQPEFPVGPHGLDQYTPVLAAIRSIFHLCRCLCSNPTQARGHLFEQKRTDVLIAIQHFMQTGDMALAIRPLTQKSVGDILHAGWPHQC
jgi:hypothetical protein